MTLVMTLLARNEADIVDAQIAFHLHAGVDFVIATDNRSEDGTSEILERYQQAGVLTLIREDGEDAMRQDEWVTRMARLAATDYGAHWVINSDADEFWWPRGGTLKDVLATVPCRYGVVRGCWRHFLPRTSDDGFFAERMVVRLTAPAHPGVKETIYHAHQKVAHRAIPDVTVERGNHNAEGPGLEPLRSWHPIEVLHFSFRSTDQLRWKTRGGWWGSSLAEPTPHKALLYEAHLEGRLEEHYESVALTDDDVERGLADGTLAIDTRLRDALRALRADEGGFVLPTASPEPRLTFPRPGLREDAAFAVEASVLAEIEGITRAAARVEALEQRIAELEQVSLRRLANGTRGLRRLDPR